MSNAHLQYHDSVTMSIVLMPENTSAGPRSKKLRPFIRAGVMAPQVGLEPTTFRLTAERSAIDLLRNILLYSLRNIGYYITLRRCCQLLYLLLSD